MDSAPRICPRKAFVCLLHSPVGESHGSPLLVMGITRNVLCSALPLHVGEIVNFFLSVGQFCSPHRPPLVLLFTCHECFLLVTGSGVLYFIQHGTQVWCTVTVGKCGGAWPFVLPPSLCPSSKFLGGCVSLCHF